jgi:hypothetical protein
MTNLHTTVRWTRSKGHGTLNRIPIAPYDDSIALVAALVDDRELVRARRTARASLTELRSLARTTPSSRAARRDPPSARLIAAVILGSIALGGALGGCVLYSTAPQPAPTALAAPEVGHEAPLPSDDHRR